MIEESEADIGPHTHPFLDLAHVPLDPNTPRPVFDFYPMPNVLLGYQLTTGRHRARVDVYAENGTTCSAIIEFIWRGDLDVEITSITKA
jgi:hypothetical protein